MFKPKLKTVALSGILSVMAAVSFASSTAVPTAATTTTTTSACDPAYFFMQTADKALLKPGSLTMINLTPKTLWFADAPNTGTGFDTTSEYMQLWSNKTSGFLANNPNATLVGYIKDPKTHKETRLTLVVNITNANFANNNLTYTVTKSLLVPDNTTETQEVILSHPTLLIDSLPVDGGGGFD